MSTNPAELYESYFVPGIHARWTPTFLARAELRPGDRVLDAACGTGVVAREAVERLGPEGSVTGVDVAPGMLEVARTRAEGVTWREADASALPFGDDGFDRVLCQQGLQFMSDRPAALAEFARVAAPGGRVVVSVWRGLDRHPLYEALCEAEARHLGTSVEAMATPFTLGDAGELRGLLEGAGLRHVDLAERSLAARFPRPERFVELTVLAAASIVPASELDAAGREALVAAVGDEIAPVLRRFVEGDEVVVPMHAHLAVARA